jgi:hypothetical protein
MVLVEHVNRIVTIAWDPPHPGQPEPYLAITAIRPHQDPSKIDVKTIRLAKADCLKLAEFITQTADELPAGTKEVSAKTE